MGKSRFQTADIVRLELSDGDWIEVRRRLSAGEERRMYSSAFEKLEGKGVTVNFATLGLSRTIAYVTDWSFRDGADKPVRCTPAAIEALTLEALKEIEIALDTHVEAQRELAKKTPTTETTSSPVSSAAGTSDGPGTITNPPPSK